MLTVQLSRMLFNSMDDLPEDSINASATFIIIHVEAKVYLLHKNMSF